MFSLDFSIISPLKLLRALIYIYCNRRQLDRPSFYRFRHTVLSCNIHSSRQPLRGFYSFLTPHGSQHSNRLRKAIKCAKPTIDFLDVFITTMAKLACLFGLVNSPTALTTWLIHRQITVANIATVKEKAEVTGSSPSQIPT